MLTSIIEDTPLRPVLDNHGQRANARVDLDICLDHARILQSERVIHVHVRSQLQLGVPHFDNPDPRLGYADNLLHAIWKM